MAKRARVLGVNKARRALQELSQFMDDPAISSAHKELASKVADIAKREAPEGPTGNLRRAIISGVFPQRRTQKIAAGFVSVQHKIAPHLHLVHEGTGPRKTASGKSTGAMPPNPFIHRAAGIARPMVKASLTALYKKEIEKAARKAARRAGVPR